MRIARSETVIIEKAARTIERTENYKTQLCTFISGLANDISKTSARLPSFLLTHFTDLENAKSIIRQGVVKPNQQGFVSFTELSPLEFHTITQNKSRKFGFGFVKTDLTEDGVDLFSPLAASRKDGIVREICEALPDLATQILCEPTSTQSSLAFSNMMEVRCRQNITLQHCALFFRDTDVHEDSSEILNSLGIFQLPHSVPWFRDYFTKHQEWHLDSGTDYLEFYDTRSTAVSRNQVRFHPRNCYVVYARYNRLRRLGDRTS